MKISVGLIWGPALALMLAGSWSALAAGPSPVVVELFTSQGCSSCPPANANLIKLSARRDVLALSFAVTYWDYLGWKDSFGKEAYTTRQRIYEPALGEAGPFTPQMVVNGRASVVGNQIEPVESLIAAAAPSAGPSVQLEDGKILVGQGEAPATGADVWLVRYDPNIVNVPVGRGENSGRTLPHTHVVHDLVRLGEWGGAAASFRVPAAANGLRTAVLVQGARGGPILAAVTD